MPPPAAYPGAMTTVLLTGFEPFAGDSANPSGDAVRAVAARWDRAETLIVEVLPVTFADAAARLRVLIERHSPDVVIATGLAGGRSAVTPERVALNLADARIPDNAGVQPTDAVVVGGAPDARFATLPVKRIAAAVAAASVPSSVSLTAGTFVCNAAMYTVLDATADRADVRAGFVHVPWSTETAPAGAPALALADIVRALEIAIDVSLTSDDGRPLVGGEIA